MGTNTWNALRCNGINAKNLMAIADQMVDLGLTDLGYKYLNMDDVSFVFFCFCFFFYSVMSFITL